MPPKRRKRGTTQRTTQPTTQPTTGTTTGTTRVGELSSTGSSGPLPLLDPITPIWFKTNDVSRAVTLSTEAVYNEPWMNYTETTEEIQNQWFNEFRSFYRWNPEIEELVREEFEETLQTRLKGMTYDNYNRKTKPKFMTPTLYQDFRTKSEAIKAGTKSAINKANKAKAGSSTHRFGCISTAQHAKRLMNKNNGIPPTALELFIDRYTTRNDVGNLEFRSQKSSELYAKIMSTIDALKEEGKPVDENAIYYDVVGGHKKGHVFGVGTAADMFFSKPHHASTSTAKTSTYVPGIISQLSSRITDTEELLRKEREDKERYILAQQESENKLRADVQALQELVRNAFPNCTNAFTATLRDPRDPSSGGGDGSGVSMGFAAV